MLSREALTQPPSSTPNYFRAEKLQTHTAGLRLPPHVLFLSVPTCNYPCSLPSFPAALLAGLMLLVVAKADPDPRTFQGHTGLCTTEGQGAMATLVGQHLDVAAGQALEWGLQGHPGTQSPAAGVSQGQQGP